MNILVINPILFTPEKSDIPCVYTIKDTMIYGFCMGFTQLGHKVTLLCAEEYKPQQNEVYEFEILFFKSNFKKIMSPAFLPFSWTCFKFLRESERKYDFVISSEVFSWYTFFSIISCSRRTIIWQELNCHQHKFHKLPSLFWYNVICRFFYRNVMSIVPRSRSSASFIAGYSNKTSSVIIDHGINLDKFDMSILKRRQFISSSQLIYRKNVAGIIINFSNFLKISGFQDFILYIVGRGPEEENLKKIVEKLNLYANVKFLGFLSQKELNLYIKESMAFLVNTRQDLNMVSIPEAIVSGTPILTNTIPASAEYIQENELGIVRNVWDENDMKNIVERNSFFVNNCISYRNNLSNIHCSQMFIDEYKHKE